jgi:hypothetical protein
LRGQPHLTTRAGRAFFVFRCVTPTPGTLRNSLHAADSPAQRRLLTRTVTEPSYWINVDSGGHGRIYPYTDSEFTAGAAADGQAHRPLTRRAR